MHTTIPATRPPGISAMHPLLGILAPLALAALLTTGCGAQPVAAVQAAPQVEAVHIQRTVSQWLDNGGRTPAPVPVNVTRTDTARVTRFYRHIRSLRSYTLPPNTPMFCPISYGQVVTMVTFTAGATTVLQVKSEQNGCVLTQVVGSRPGTYLSTDPTFDLELDDLIAHVG